MTPEKLKAAAERYNAWSIKIKRTKCPETGDAITSCPARYKGQHADESLLSDWAASQLSSPSLSHDICMIPYPSNLPDTDEGRRVWGAAQTCFAELVKAKTA